AFALREIAVHPLAAVRGEVALVAAGVERGDQRQEKECGEQQESSGHEALSIISSANLRSGIAADPKSRMRSIARLVTRLALLTATSLPSSPAIPSPSIASSTS